MAVEPRTGRYVVVNVSWNRTLGPEEGWLDGAIHDGDVPEGTKVASFAEASARGGGMNQWVALQFPRSSDATAYLNVMREAWMEDEEIDDHTFRENFARFTSKRDAEDHLDDVSTGSFLGLR